MANKSLALNTDNLKSRIYTIRGMQVMLDKDLAELYNVKTRRLRQQVKRNIKRFPLDFMFQLTDSEVDFLVSQNVTPSKKHLGGHLPYAFTEQEYNSLRLQIVTLEKNRPENLKSQIATLEKREFEDLESSFTTKNEQNLKCQIGTSRWGGNRKIPAAF